jgi:outer membrane receptor protein involved in Fe transport
MHYTYGANITDQEPLSGIPPMSGLAEISWQGEDIKTDLSFRFVFAQNRLSAIDKLDLRIPEGGSSRWHTVNWRISKEIHSRISISLAVNNIFDMNYREHLSGLNAPGRNLIFGARSRF